MRPLRPGWRRAAFIAHPQPTWQMLCLVAEPLETWIDMMWFDDDGTPWIVEVDPRGRAWTYATTLRWTFRRLRRKEASK